MSDTVTEPAPQPAPSTKSSIMEGLKSSPKSTTVEPASAAESNSTTADWYFADGVPGVGSKPDYLSPKYKTLAEQAKAYDELYKTVRNTSGAPEQYELGDYGNVIKADNPHMQKLMNYAKENRFSQDAFQEIVGTLVEYEKSQQPNIDAEIAKLGVDGATKIKTVQTWAENTFSQEALDTIGKIAKNADVINMLDEMRQYVHHTASQPPGSNMAGEPFVKLTVAEVEAEMKSNYKRYTNDANYRREIQEKFRQAVGDE